MKKVLIIGNSVKEYALARKMSESCEVHVAPGNPTMADFVTCVDIRETSSAELLEYVMETGIDLTIPVSQKALETDIVRLFENNRQQIFAPVKAAGYISCDKASAKRLLYKLHVPTPKFGIFEKPSLILDYIKNMNTPFVIKTNENSSATVLTSYNSAKNIVESLLASANQKVIIEDYVWGTPFGFYAITDGYKALPIGSSIIYKHSLDGDGGQLTGGMGACMPNYKLSFDNEDFLINGVIYPTLEYLQREGAPYVGIIGINGILTENGGIQVLGYQSFLQDSDCEGILELINTDIYSLFESCVMGTFSDDVEFVEQKDLSAVSVVLNCNNKNNNENVIAGIDTLDDETNISYYPNTIKNRYLEFEANYGPVMLLTAFGRTLTNASEKVYNEVNAIDFKGKSFRTDICKPVLIEV